MVVERGSTRKHSKVSKETGIVRKLNKVHRVLEANNIKKRGGKAKGKQAGVSVDSVEPGEVEVCSGKKRNESKL